MLRKVIKDIRYYEDRINGKRILRLPKFLQLIGARYSCKLRELGFETKEYDHIYLKLTSQLPHGEVEISSQWSEKWFIYVSAGVSTELFGAMNEIDKFHFIVALTTSGLELLCVRDGLNYSLVKQVEKEVLTYKTELEILHKFKDTINYQATVSYQINPKGQSSIAYITYWDKNKNTKCRKPIVQLNNYEDIFFLVKDIVVKNGVITLKPRRSFKASLYTNSYNIPLTIAVKDLI